MKKILNLLLSILFFLGWGIFYMLEFFCLLRVLKNGCFFTDGKGGIPMNIWLWFISQIVFVLITCLLVKKWLPQILDTTLLPKLKILLFSFLFFILWILLYFGVIFLSIQFGIAHVECFWILRRRYRISC